MEILRELLLAAHLIGMAIIVGGYFAHIRAPRVRTGMLCAAVLQLLTGLLLVSLAEAGDGQVDQLRTGIKLTVALAVTVCAAVGLTKEKSGAEAVAASGGIAQPAASSGGAAQASPSSAAGPRGAATTQLTPASAQATSGTTTSARATRGTTTSAQATRGTTASAKHPSAALAHLTFALTVLAVVAAVAFR